MIDIPVLAPRLRFASFVSALPRVASLHIGVAHPPRGVVNRATSFNGLAFFPCWLLADDFQSLVVGVGHAHRPAAPGSLSAPCPGPPLGPSCWQGVGHPIQTLPEMRRADPRSAGIDRPEGVVRSLHVSLYKVEPCEAAFTRNLLAKNCERS
jgi:hypothetical protein